MIYAYFLVEGPHDVEAIGRILKHHGAERIRNMEDLDPYWNPLIPKSFPFEGDLLKRVPVPTFFRSETVSIAIHTSGGDSKFVDALKQVSRLAKLFDMKKLSAIALFYDADRKEPFVRNQELLRVIHENSDHVNFFSSVLSMVEQPGVVYGDECKVGMFAFPDNENSGTLEDLLLWCAEESYPDLLMMARDYVGTVPEEFRKKWGQSDENKVLVGCISNVLRPGKANQVSIQDNKWVCKETMHLPSVDKLNQFITELLNLS